VQLQGSWLKVDSVDAFRLLATDSGGFHGHRGEKQADGAAILVVGLIFNVGISIKLSFYVLMSLKIGCWLDQNKNYSITLHHDS
jgi:hypothetical protein